MIDIEKQHEYMIKYKIDPIEIGRLCECYPGLQKSWEQFSNTLNLCKVQCVDQIDHR